MGSQNSTGGLSEGGIDGVLGVGITGAELDPRVDAVLRTQLDHLVTAT
jgi:hypothetical protein